MNKCVSLFLIGSLLIVLITACNLPARTVTENNSNNLLPNTSEETATPAPRILNVDDYGANPFDDQPDSKAIQSALNDLENGEILEFTSGGNDESYLGYLINETLFIVMSVPKHGITLRSTNPEELAVLEATADLLGFVIHLYSRATYNHSAGLLDDITLESLDIDGGRDIRVCAGTDGLLNGEDDNWGSWVDGECPNEEDPWCNAGGISLTGLVNFGDYGQNYQSKPGDWSTGLLVDNVIIRNVECGTALGLSGAESGVTNSTIDTAGEHTHVRGCATTDLDGEMAFWADGITFDGTRMTVENNTVINASDVGIVFFGGKDTRIVNNTVISENGNYGAFAGILVGTAGFSNISGLELSNNTVISTSDKKCGGLHTGINIGQFMWNRGCIDEAGSGTVGNVGTCSEAPVPPEGAHCEVGQLCQVWAYVPPNGTISLKDNLVRGAHINYLVIGVEVLGNFEISGNISEAPQETGWEAAAHGCDGVIWGPLDFVAQNPTIDGWVELRVHCTR